MTALPTEKVIYTLPVLIQAFTQALEDKKAYLAKVKLGDWAKDYPQANTKREQLSVNWLEAQQRSGFSRIETKSPISDFSAMGPYDHLLLRQIECGLARGLK